MRAKRLIENNIILAIVVGIIGFVANLPTLQLFPGVYLLFGGSLVIALAARRGPLAGALAGLIAGSRTMWLWSQPFPISAVILCLEGATVGYLCARRKTRPLYAAVAYWLAAGCWIQFLVQFFLLQKALVPASIISLRNAVNGILNGLLAEFALLAASYVMFRWRRREDVFRLGLSSTVGLMLMMAISLTAILAVSTVARKEREKAYSAAKLESESAASSASREIGERLSATARSVWLIADQIGRNNPAITEKDQVRATLDALRNNQGDLAGVSISGIDGDIIAFSSTEIPVSLSSGGSRDSYRLGFERAFKQRSAVVSTFSAMPGSVSSSRVVLIVPVVTGDGTALGCITAWYRPKMLGSLLESLEADETPVSIRVINGQGDTLAFARIGTPEDSPKPSTDVAASQVAAPLTPVGSKLSGDAIPYTQVISGSIQEANYVERIAWKAIPSTDWKAIAEHPMLPVERELAGNNLKVLFELIGFLLSALLISNFIGNRLTRPLAELETYALKIAGGNLETRPTKEFVLTEEAHRLRSAFSKMAGALHKSWLEQHASMLNAKLTAREAEAQTRHVAALNLLGQELSLTFDLQNICRAAHKYIQTQLHASGFLISLFSEKEELIKTVYAWGDGKEYDIAQLPIVPLGHGSHSQCIRTKAPLLVDQVDSMPGYKQVHLVGAETDPRTPESLLYLPLISFDRVVGTLQVQGYSRSQFKPDDIERLMSVASQIAVSLNNSMLFEQVRLGKLEWEKTFDSMSDGVFLFDRDARVVRVNRAGAQMDGARLQDLIGKRCCEVLSACDAEECFVEQAINSGARVVKEIVTSRYKRILLLTVEPVYVEGQSAASVCVARDITELRRAEAEVKSQREFVAQLVENAQEAIFTFDVFGRITWFNKRFIEAMGYQATEVPKLDVRQLMCREDLDEMEKLSSRVFSGNDEASELRFAHGQGRVRWFKITLTPVRADGKITSVLAVARDTTDERKAAEQMQSANKLAAVGQLAAGVAHDFNNLLVPILGRAQLLKRQAADARMIRGLEVIEKAALDGAATVRRLQNFSRRTSDERKVPVEVSQLLRDVVELTRTRWRDDALAKGIKYDIQLQFEDKAQVMGSPSELREVFTNLVINALDAMPSGGKLVFKSERENQSVNIVISDSGSGMSAEVRERVFEPFYTTKGHAGNGLGLAVSYGIINRHEGTIVVESAPGCGTSFTIKLPLCLNTETQAPAASAARLNSSRILVIDDEEIVRQTLVEILTVMGHTVFEAGGGRVGLQMLSTTPVDVVLTDLAMPDLDGWTIAREIRARYPNVRIALVTGYGAMAEPADENSGLVDSIIGKPYDYNQISELVDELSRKQPECELV